MSLFIQHGAHKADKISEALKQELCPGLILSPKNEKKPENIISFCREIKEKYPAVEVYFDPQFHYSAYESEYEGYLSNYSYFKSELKRKDFLNPGSIQNYVDRVLSFQLTLEVDGLFSPTVIIKNFNDRFSQVALQLMMASEEYVKGSGKKIYHSLIISEEAFRNKEDVDEMLNVLTSFDADGFYLVIDRSSKDYNQRFDSDVLSLVMYFIYKLSIINLYDVKVGYSDIVGLLMLVSGASSFACGWYGSQKLFSTLRFVPVRGGNQPRPRYTSNKLLNSILTIPELDAACNLGLKENVASHTGLDAELLRNRDAPWDIKKSSLHHWKALKMVADEIDHEKNIKDKIIALEAKISNAQENYITLRNNGIVFEQNSNSNHLKDWKSAIVDFRKLVKLS